MRKSAAGTDLADKPAAQVHLAVQQSPPLGCCCSDVVIAAERFSS